MRKYLNIVINITTLAVFGYLLAQFIGRAFFGTPGDALVPLLFAVMLIVSAGLYQRIDEIGKDTAFTADVMRVTLDSMETESKFSKDYQNADMN